MLSVMALDSDHFVSVVPGLKKRRFMVSGLSIITVMAVMDISPRMAALKLP